jgi:hypothetical protein
VDAEVGGGIRGWVGGHRRDYTAGSYKGALRN